MLFVFNHLENAILKPAWSYYPTTRITNIKTLVLISFSKELEKKLKLIYCWRNANDSHSEEQFGF